MTRAGSASSTSGWRMRSMKSPLKETAARPCLERGRPSPLARRHAQGAIEPDYLAVDHRVLAQVEDQRGIFGWPAEPARERNARGEALLNVRRQSLQHWRLEET